VGTASAASKISGTLASPSLVGAKMDGSSITTTAGDTSSTSSEWSKTRVTALTTAALLAIDSMPDPKLADQTRKDLV
jgi:hypothetical protein